MFSRIRRHVNSIIPEQHVKTNIVNVISAKDRAMANIESITSLIQHLEMSVRYWTHFRYFVVGATALFTVLSFIAFWVHGGRSDSLSKAKEDLSIILSREANEKIAEANARAASAELELAKLKKERSISSEQRIKFFSHLKEFAHTDFTLAAEHNESIIFAKTIGDTLVENGWNRKDCIDQSWILNDITYRIGVVTTTGVHIQIFDPSIAKAQEALFKALNDAGFEKISKTLEPDKISTEHPYRKRVIINVGPRL